LGLPEGGVSPFRFAAGGRDARVLSTGETTRTKHWATNTGPRYLALGSGRITLGGKTTEGGRGGQALGEKMTGSEAMVFINEMLMAVGEGPGSISQEEVGSFIDNGRRHSGETARIK